MTNISPLGEFKYLVFPNIRKKLLGDQKQGENVGDSLVCHHSVCSVRCSVTRFLQLCYSN